MAKYNQCILCGYHANLRTYHPEFRVCSKCESEIMNNGIVKDIPERKMYMSWYQIKERCSRNNVFYDISFEDIKNLYIEAGCNCSVLGIPFNLLHRDVGHTYPFMPAVDRIDPSAGYSKANCRIVSNIVNNAKEDWSNNIFNYIFTNYTDLITMDCDKTIIKRLFKLSYNKSAALKRVSKLRNLPYDLSTNIVRKLLDENNYRCAITNIPFNTFNPDNVDSQRLPFMPAVMRNNPSLGFTLDNVSLVCQIVCSAKYNFSEDIFKITFKYIEEYNPDLWNRIKHVVNRWNL